MITKNIEAEPINDLKDNKVTIRLNINMIIVGTLAVLLFVSIIQTVTLASLISKKPVSPDSDTQSTGSQAVGGGKSTLPAALKDVPQQVGGC